MDKDKEWLANWIKEKLEKGLSPDMIKKILKKSGYSSEVVDECTNLMKKPETKHMKSRNIEEKIKEEKITLKEIEEKTQEEEPIVDVSKTKTQVKLKVKKDKETIEIDENKWIKTGIEGLDTLFKKGIPRGSIILVIGGPGSGKTIFCLQTLYHAVQNGEKALYMTFEEKPEKLREHMRDFGWDPEKYEREGLLRIKKYDPLKISKLVEALLEKAEGELKIDIPPLFLEDDFKPNRVFVDSLAAIAAAFASEEGYYRIYIEQFFEQFRNTDITPFLITESQEFPKRLTKSGVEEFLADGVIILHMFRKGGHKERGVEIYKLRGADFEEKVVAMEIVSDKGIIVHPTQEVFVSIE
jgi:KaiC/GvpD/RAD55 family RecA-like ATPase